jgi:hypothetical protein
MEYLKLERNIQMAVFLIISLFTLIKLIKRDYHTVSLLIVPNFIGFLLLFIFIKIMFKIHRESMMRIK